MENEKDLGKPGAAPAATVETQKESGYDFAPWEPPFRYDGMGSMILDSKDRMIVDVRGWGFLTGRGGLRSGMSKGLSEEVAAGIQDRLGKFVTELLNRASLPSDQVRDRGKSGNKRSAPEATVSGQNATLLNVVKAAYLKHHCGQENIGWEELSNMMFRALRESMGDTGFQRWLNENSEGN